MPQMRGPQLAERVRAVRAGIKVLFMSGYVDRDAASADELRGEALIAKPFTLEALAKKLAELLEP